ncbi:MAG TPA: hypothetical protein VHA37_06995 [Candidatus Saccharimonadales bacterium]|nr:hypothetical protein [Candidatus Saccharimonadales bacterium]
MTHRPYLLRSLSHMAVKNTREQEDVKEEVGKSQEVLVTAKTVFPFSMFPDTVSVDRTNLTIAHRIFYRVASIITIKIEDIHNIKPNVGPLFGSLVLTTTFVDPDSPYRVNYLRRADALKVTRIVRGYKTALQRKIDTSGLEKKELVELLDNLARDGTDV